MSSLCRGHTSGSMDLLPAEQGWAHHRRTACAHSKQLPAATRGPKLYLRLWMYPSKTADMASSAKGVVVGIIKYECEDEGVLD